MAAKLMKYSITFRHRIAKEFGRRLNSSSTKLSDDLECAFNNQINLEFFASFSYLAMVKYSSSKQGKYEIILIESSSETKIQLRSQSLMVSSLNFLKRINQFKYYHSINQMAAFFGKQSVAFPGCCKYFSNQVLDEREHAQKLIDYLLRRGNTVKLQSIPAPATQCWDSPLAAFQDAVELEKHVTQQIHLLRETSEKCGDLCACILLDNEFLENQIEESDRLSRYVAQLKIIGADGTGIFMFDRSLLKDSK